MALCTNWREAGQANDTNTGMKITIYYVFNWMKYKRSYIMVILSFNPPPPKKTQRKNEGKSLKRISYNIIISGLIKKSGVKG